MLFPSRSHTRNTGYLLANILTHIPTCEPASAVWAKDRGGTEHPNSGHSQTLLLCMASKARTASQLRACRHLLKHLLWYDKRSEKWPGKLPFSLWRRQPYRLAYPNWWRNAIALDWEIATNGMGKLTAQFTTRTQATARAWTVGNDKLVQPCRARVVGCRVCDVQIRCAGVENKARILLKDATYTSPYVEDAETRRPQNADVDQMHPCSRAGEK